MTPKSLHISKAWLAAGLALWVLLTFGHGTGLDVVTAMVSWARQPGTVSPAGGDIGFVHADRILTAIFACLLAVAAAALLWRQRHSDPRPVDPRQWADALVPWVLWTLLAILAWKVIVTYSTELVHFVQYALIGAVLHRALGDRRPLLAFAGGMVLGCIDELWQHYGLHVWLMGEQTHYLDFSDPVLNALGLSLGLLPAVTRMRLRGEGGDDAPATAPLTAAVAAAILLPILLLDPVTVSRWFGSYPWYPFWDEHTNHKAVHWVTPAEGIPILLLVIIVLGGLLDPRGRGLSLRRIAACAACAVVAVQPPTRRAGMPVHEEVPRVIAPRAAAPIAVDGSLDEPDWATSPRLGPFVDNVDGDADLQACGHAAPQPTHARVLWDDDALYLSFEVADADVWAPDAARDDDALAYAEGIRVFVDDGGDEVAYYEVDVSPAGQVRDLFRFVGAAPLDFNPWSQVIGLRRWDAHEARIAARVHGSLETATSYFTPVASPPDSGYTVEMALPWEIFRTTSTPTGQLERLSLPPRPGQYWRLGLYRLERPRLPAADSAAGVLTEAEARRRLGVDAAGLAALAAAGDVDTTADGAFTAEGIWRRHLNDCTETQAWSPTYLDIALAPRFGVVEFGTRPPEARP